MTKNRHPPPAPEDLPELYVEMFHRLERVDGLVQQLLAERTRDSTLRPTWKDIEGLRAEIGALRRKS